MEMANSGTVVVRPVIEADQRKIFRLLQEAPYSHAHVDWHAPVDWIGTHGFVLCEGINLRGEPDVVACLAVASDPPPAAWVRLAAVQSGQEPEAMLESLFQAVLPHLREAGLTQLGWFPVRLWPEEWFKNLGFETVNRIATYIKEGMDIPTVRGEEGVLVRPAELDDMADLAALEIEAFEPLWRHSALGLSLAYRQAQSFDVAEINGRPAGFQYSVEGHQSDSAHLVRITVAKDLQNRGIGSALMAAAMRGYKRRGVRLVTLNTQVDNVSSHRLYQRFDFRRLKDELPVWGMRL